VRGALPSARPLKLTARRTHCNGLLTAWQSRAARSFKTTAGQAQATSSVNIRRGRVRFAERRIKVIRAARCNRAGAASHQPPSIGIAQVEAIGSRRQRSIYRSVAARAVAMQSDWHGNAYSVPLGEKASTAVLKWLDIVLQRYPGVTRSGTEA
jgi:hypothetical protein